MKKIIELLFKKPTLFSISGLLIILIGIPSGIYGLSLKGMAGIGGAYILFGVFISSMILVFDRIASRVVALRKLNIIESIILLIGVSVYAYSIRSLVIDQESNKIGYFVLAENNGTLQNSESAYLFPFSKKIVSNNNIAVIPSISAINNRLKLRPPDGWKSYYMTARNIENIKVHFYSKDDFEEKKEAIDSLIKKEIKSVVTIQ